MTNSIVNSRLLGINSDFSRAIERLRDAAQAPISYPKYNLYSSNEGDHVLIEVAIAGFSKSDIIITQDARTLTIKATNRPSHKTDDDLVSRHHGISNKDFCLSWHVSNGLEVVRAEVLDGILSVELRSPETTESARVIPIK